MMDTTNNDSNDVEPVAGLSSASACINIKLLDEYKFKPLYTHQCFDKEYLPGFAPFEEDEIEAHEILQNLQKAAGETDESIMNQPHPSFTYDTPSAQVRINVQLTPSCRQHILTHVTRGFDEDKRKEEKITYSAVNDDVQKESVRLSGKKRKIDSGKARAGDGIAANHSEKKLSEEILKKLSRGLPQTESCDISKEEQENGNYLLEPIGTVVKRYHTKVQGQKTEFVLSLANGHEANRYHHEIQKLALFFIENADCVDLTSDEGGGMWKVLYLFQKHTIGQSCSKSKSYSKKFNGYSLVGYMTLFGFYAPFRKPKPGIVLRICQALVLPPYQRQGHGKQMMRLVYDYSNGLYNGTFKEQNESAVSLEIVEVNVEDPAPGFTFMRDAIDYELFQSAISDNVQVKPLIQPYLGNNYKPMPDTVIKTVASIAKKTPTQIQIAYEIYKLDQLNKHITKIETEDYFRNEQIDGARKAYRLMVKSRLNKLHKEEIGVCSSRIEKKERLSTIFEEIYARYQRILGTRCGQMKSS